MNNLDLIKYKRFLHAIVAAGITVGGISIYNKLSEEEPIENIIGTGQTHEAFQKWYDEHRQKTYFKVNYDLMLKSYLEIPEELMNHDVIKRVNEEVNNYFINTSMCSSNDTMHKAVTNGEVYNHISLYKPTMDDLDIEYDDRITINYSTEKVGDKDTKVVTYSHSLVDESRLSSYISYEFNNENNIYNYVLSNRISKNNIEYTATKMQNYDAGFETYDFDANDLSNQTSFHIHLARNSVGNSNYILQIGNLSNNIDEETYDLIKNMILNYTDDSLTELDSCENLVYFLDDNRDILINTFDTYDSKEYISNSIDMFNNSIPKMLTK